MTCATRSVQISPPPLLGRADCSLEASSFANVAPGSSSSCCLRSSGRARVTEFPGDDWPGSGKSAAPPRAPACTEIAFLVDEVMTMIGISANSGRSRKAQVGSGAVHVGHLVVGDDPGQGISPSLNHSNAARGSANERTVTPASIEAASFSKIQPGSSPDRQNHDQRHGPPMTSGGRSAPRTRWTFGPRDESVEGSHLPISHASGTLSIDVNNRLKERGCQRTRKTEISGRGASLRFRVSRCRKLS